MDCIGIVISANDASNALGSIVKNVKGAHYLLIPVESQISTSNCTRTQMLFQVIIAQQNSPITVGINRAELNSTISKQFLFIGNSQTSTDLGVLDV